PQVVAIKDISATSPNASLLKTGDIITSVDGSAITTPQSLLDAIQAKPVGSTLTFGIKRDGTQVTITVTTVTGDQGKPIVGFTPEVRSSAPFTIKIPIEGIGGPSAGLMLSLGIVDKLEPEDLTGGKIIAGTGTIDADGNVG